MPSALTATPTPRRPCSITSRCSITSGADTPRSVRSALRSSSVASMLRRRHGGALGLPLHAANRCVIILNQMVQYSGSRFDASFAALSDATRRGVLEQLWGADASITELADKFHMTLTGMKKHVGVLEKVGLVPPREVGR